MCFRNYNLGSNYIMCLQTKIPFTRLFKTIGLAYFQFLKNKNRKGREEEEDTKEDE